MGYSKFGEFMRIMRIKNHEIMVDTAELLNVKLPFVSMVENGKKNVPKEWIPILVEHYKLNEEEEKELKDAVEQSKTQLKINLVNVNDSQRNVAIQFQRSFEKLDKKTADAIINILNKGEN